MLANEFGQQPGRYGGDDKGDERKSERVSDGIAVAALAVGKSGEEFPLEQGAWLLSRTQYPDINVEAYEALMDSFAADLRERFAKGGSMPLTSTPEELRKRYEDWSVIFGRLAKDMGLQPM